MATAREARARRAAKAARKQKKRTQTRAARAAGNTTGEIYYDVWPDIAERAAQIVYDRGAADGYDAGSKDTATEHQGVTKRGSHPDDGRDVFRLVIGPTYPHPRQLIQVLLPWLVGQGGGGR